ncbi:uncharacterized protein F5Z01DRAFT_176075 [Emericellopsis atlantica]|uniref:Zn(2)-C6 fungal-type domain-containing protein n=1 Tax=Emericellopsis atlantica TaxID=2614577 RepID=A0A9P7ZJB3_9HYPO|nr:uncharacterized protein F5Z01DRAFT_176075 [Emericellopsis atlantica]KAG9253159.1 hypothetical protein F5Z01DRAFT_176075 [Emericellopsis atlantica]
MASLTFSLRSSSEPLAPALRKACDRCRRRKTRCDGQPSCKTCLLVGVECSYRTVSKPVGRRPRKPRCSPQGPPPTTPSMTSQSPGPDNDATAQTWSVTWTSKQPEEESTRALFHPDVAAADFIADSQPYQEQFLLDDMPTSPWSSYPLLNFYSPSLNNSLLFDLFTDASTIETPSCIASSCNVVPPTPAAPSDDWRVPPSTFTPYTQLYFDRLYPVFPVLERHQLDSTASWDQYALASSLGAAITAQLNLVDPSTIHRPSSSSASSALRSSSSPPQQQQPLPGQVWTDHALQARQAWDYMSAPTESTIMTSFFLFVYYDNAKRPQKAGYYLREAIGFALALGLDDLDTYHDAASHDDQRRCRLFWLLFITERFYALQHRGSVLLRSTIPLPQVFTSPQPKLIYGFVSLVHLFKCVDDKFVSLWRTSRAVLTWGSPSASASVASVADDTGKAAWQGPLCDSVAGQSMEGELVEVQRLDIAVTQQWLHLLAWQLQDARAASRRVPFVVSRETLGVVTRADRQCLEAHGIGMEQKLFAIACCVSDVLQRSAELDRDAVSMGHQYLHGFMRVLSSFRNRESEYLQPLLARATKTLTAELSVPPTLTLPCESDVSGRGESGRPEHVDC